MKIDVNAFLESLPIMGVGLLGIFIVTIVIILGIYLLKAVTPKSDDTVVEHVGEDATKNNETDKVSGNSGKNRTHKKSARKTESAMDLMKEREKKDFFEEEESNYISRDL